MKLMESICDCFHKLQSTLASDRLNRMPVIESSDWMTRAMDEKRAECNEDRERVDERERGVGESEGGPRWRRIVMPLLLVMRFV